MPGFMQAIAIYKSSKVVQLFRLFEYCRMANFSFVGVSVSNISEKRTYVFSIFNFPFLCRPLILVYKRVNINGYLHVQGLNCSNARGDGTDYNQSRDQSRNRSTAM